MNDLQLRKQELIDNLHKALELELSTIPPYLTALLSIKPNTNKKSAALIHSVAMEEMLHMLLVCNLIASIGGKVTFNKKNVPTYPLTLEFKGEKFKDREFEINLEKFSESAIDTFLKIEMPTEFIGRKKSMLRSSEMEIPGITIGAFYEQLKHQLNEACDVFSEPEVFSGDPANQLGENFYWKGDGEPIKVVDLASAHKAIDLIITQGEGCSDSIFDLDTKYFNQRADIAHYFKFNEIKHHRSYQETDTPTEPPTGEAFDVNYHQAYPLLKNPTTQSYENSPVLSSLNKQFNSNYSVMLYQIAEAFNGSPNVLYTAINNGMRSLSPIALQMMEIPVPNHENYRGTPSFEWIEPEFDKKSQVQEISLISKWQLLDGCPPELYQELNNLANKVKEEAGTLMYLVHLQSEKPLNQESKPIIPEPSEIPLTQQTEVIFIEIYKDAQAFSDHVTGEIFNTFKDKYFKYFKPDPITKGWPLTKTEFLTRRSGFIKNGI
ncbi:ferritin-like domain-containing protein [Colwellia sp. RE-S-Sl-9]